MAIADVLSDAVSAIEDYQKDGYCESLGQEIAVAKTVMNGLRLYLDSYIYFSVDADGMLEKLREAIRSLDVSAIAAAVQEIEWSPQ